MKRLILLMLVVGFGGCSADRPDSSDCCGTHSEATVLRQLPVEVQLFIRRKEQLAQTLANRLGVTPDRATLQYFRLARKGDYRAASKIYQDLRERGGKVESTKHDPNLRLPLWDPLLEAQLAMEAYACGEGRFATVFGNRIAELIPVGSVLFAGTDAGRALPGVFSKPGPHGDPFFVLSQNQLVDGQHLNYLQAAFGDRIHALTAADSQKAFQEYLEDVKSRYEHDENSPDKPRQLIPGENVKLVEGKVEVSGLVCVMMVNGLLAKMVFENNPDHEFFVEESFPLDWMYPHLTPHGLIMKINRDLIPDLTADIVARDHEYWRNLQHEYLGDWLKPETPVQEVCAFAETVFLQKNLAGFTGDPAFLRNDYAMTMYSKLRSAHGGLYAWRISHSRSPEEQARMIKESDFAFRQAFASCPCNFEVVARYLNLLSQSGRVDDALRVVRTAAKLNPAEKQFPTLIRLLEGIKQGPTK